VSAQEEGRGDAGLGGDGEASPADREMAREIADFIAVRAFRFEDHECRAWALTDFGVWTTLAGREPELKMVELD